MRYLKKFSLIKESIDLDQLKEFSDGYLAYLLDDGFETSCWRSFGGLVPSITLMIDLKVNITTRSQRFSWDEIKDHFIPFLTMLQQNYKLKSGQPVRIDGFGRLGYGFSQYYNLNSLEDLQLDEIGRIMITIIDKEI